LASTVSASTQAPSAEKPILVHGGFLIGTEAYAPLVACLERLSGQPVVLVPVSRLDWLLTLFLLGWARLLDRVAPLAAKLAGRSPSGRITLAGHSSGGSCCGCSWPMGPSRGAATAVADWQTPC
jgi:hypothetical protein